MKQYSIPRILLTVAGFLLFAVGVLLVITGAAGAWQPEPQAVQVNVGSGFSYQGYLTEDGGRPVDGTCSFTFTLFDRDIGGNQIGGIQELSGVEVVEGSFAVVLNAGNEFGDEAFDGQARWLEITVDCGRGETTFDRRHELLAVPYAHSLRPGATINGNTAAETGVLNLAGGDYGLMVSTTAGSGIYIDAAGGHGLEVDLAGGDGVRAHGSNYGGYFRGSAAGINTAATTADGIDLILSGYFDGEGVAQGDGRISTAPNLGFENASMFLLSGNSTTVRLDADGSQSDSSSFIVAEGVEPLDSDNDVTHMRVNADGVEGQRFFVMGTTGALISEVTFNANSDGVYARAGDDDLADLVLGGSAEFDSSQGDSAGDDGIIQTQTGDEYRNADLILRSNDRVSVELNADRTTGENSDFEVRDQNLNLLFNVDSGGNTWTRSLDDTEPDLILGGTNNSVTGDDGIIASEPDLLDSDIVLRSNDAVRIDLNADGAGDDTVGSLEVYDNDGNLLFIVDTNGNVCIGNCPP